MQVTKRSGLTEPLNITKIHKVAEWACKGLDVSQSELEVEANLLFFNNIKTSQIHDALISAAASLNSLESQDYTFVAGRLLLQKLFKETCGSVDYPHLSDYINKAIDGKHLNPDLATKFDLNYLNGKIDASRDLQFTYIGLQTLADRYFVRDSSRKIIELPQHFYMRVAMGLAIEEDHPTLRAAEFYEELSSQTFQNSTPTLFNSGTLHSQMSSCFLNTVADSITADEGENKFASIFGTIEECAILSKYAGGIGSDWHRVREANSRIVGTDGQSSGIVPYLKIYNDTAVAVNQGGKRMGSFAPYIEPSHPDLYAFIDIKKESGDDHMRAHDIFPALWMPDLFFIRKEAREMWSFFSVSKYPELHELYGDAYVKRYEELESQGAYTHQIPALDVWKKILGSLFETGHPWATFKDECNRRSPQQHDGMVHNSNLCCMTADQRVVTSEGIWTVGDMFERDSSCGTTRSENMVMGLYGKTSAGLMLKPRPDAPIVRIETAEGYQHKVTPDHRVMVRSGEWVEAQHLQVGDQLLIQQTEGLFGANSNVDGAIAAAKLGINTVPDFVWTGTKETVRAYLGNIDMENPYTLEFAQNLQILHSNFGTKCVIDKVPDGYSVRTYPLSTKKWATFAALTSLPNEDAFCLRVDSDNHAWTVNGMITHNTEITLNTSDDETAVCNIGSVNLSKIKDFDHLRTVVRTAMRMLDNVININFYGSSRAKTSNMRHRPIGIGMMGYTEYLVKNSIDWESQEHLEKADELLEHFSYYAIEASADLARERGTYESFKGSLWSQGILPIDTAKPAAVELTSRVYVLDWDALRTKVKGGMRNSNTMAIAPTATISNIVGTTATIEPIFKREVVKKNLSGSFTVTDPCLRYGRIDLCKEAFEIDPMWVIKAAAVRQKYLDQAQSTNIFVKANVKGKDLDDIYTTAWKLGLKTTYYLRGQSAEAKGAVIGALPVVEVVEEDKEPVFCSIDNADCESCQ